ncbi:MAG: HesB/IscA family protein [Lacibacter sp.]
MEILNSTPVQFTSSAIQELKRLYQNEPEGKLLRIGVKGGGCSGLSYVLEFDEPKENDDHFCVQEVSCIIDKAHALYLTGMEIHWDNGLNNRGFTFINPNASKTCGCGTSFAV